MKRDDVRPSWRTAGGRCPDGSLACALSPSVLIDTVRRSVARRLPAFAEGDVRIDLHPVCGPSLLAHGPAGADGAEAADARRGMVVTLARSIPTADGPDCRRSSTSPSMARARSAASPSRASRPHGGVRGRLDRPRPARPGDGRLVVVGVGGAGVATLAWLAEAAASTPTSWRSTRPPWRWTRCPKTAARLGGPPRRRASFCRVRRRAMGRPRRTRRSSKASRRFCARCCMAPTSSSSSPAWPARRAAGRRPRPPRWPARAAR
ncbi:MAG: hypothetical protein U0470_07205 [Anaerolineae bacterium]